MEDAFIFSLILLPVAVIYSSVGAGAVFDLPVRLRAREENLKGRSTEILFKLSVPGSDDLSTTQTGKNLGPTQ